ncbi:MAG TPA: hypothetical protein VHD62_16000 [Opitutaceae bacterium]|nr:hypothetical protein [Opitutaceae bacterium]
MTHSLSFWFSRFPAARRISRRCAAGALLIALAGCATGTISMVATIAGGERVRIPVGKKGVEPAEEDGLRVESAIFTLNAEKKLTYIFELSDARNRAWRQVRVEDVSDTAPFVLVEDAQPELKNGHWRTTSRPFGQSDSNLAWVATITNSVRVFRFTVTFADGKTLTLLQGEMYPDFIKAAARHEWGENY